LRKNYFLSLEKISQKKQSHFHFFKMSSWFSKVDAAENERIRVRSIVENLLTAYKTLVSARAQFNKALVKETTLKLLSIDNPLTVAEAAASKPIIKTSFVNLDDKDAKKEMVIQIGLTVDALWSNDKTWWTGSLIGSAMDNETPIYTILFSDGHIKDVGADEIRSFTGTARTGNPKYMTTLANEAYKSLLIAEIAMSKLKPIASVLLELIGPQLILGQHIWMNDGELPKELQSKFCEVVLRRYKLNQVATVNFFSSLSLVSDPVNTTTEKLVKVPMAVSLCWQTPAGIIDFVPSFSEVLNDPTIDDVNAVGAIYAAFQPFAQHMNPKSRLLIL